MDLARVVRRKTLGLLPSLTPPRTACRSAQLVWALSHWAHSSTSMSGYEDGARDETVPRGNEMRHRRGRLTDNMEFFGGCTSFCKAAARVDSACFWLMLERKKEMIACYMSSLCLSLAS